MILMEIFTLVHVETWILSTGRDVMVSLMNVLWMGWTFTNSKLRTMYEREEKRHTSHIAERFIQRGERDTGSNPVGRLDFFRSVAFICIDFRNFFFAYHRRYPFEISSATEVIGHADSEYAVIFYRELISKKPFYGEVRQLTSNGSFLRSFFKIPIKFHVEYFKRKMFSFRSSTNLPTTNASGVALCGSSTTTAPSGGTSASSFTFEATSAYTTTTGKHLTWFISI